MKKQLNPTIKAHLIRSAFYLLLLLGVCAIPFALAQRNAGKRSQATNMSQLLASRLPTTSNVGAVASKIALPPNPPLPAVPAAVLYDQMTNPAPTPGGVTSQDFETVNDPFDTFAADDFVVPAGQTWTISEVDVAGEYGNGPGPAASFNVFFYTDSATLPGTLIATRLANPFSNGANAMITLTSPVVLTAGTYWVSVQAREDFTPFGQWFWTTARSYRIPRQPGKTRAAASARPAPRGGSRPHVSQLKMGRTSCSGSSGQQRHALPIRSPPAPVRSCRA